MVYGSEHRYGMGHHFNNGGTRMGEEQLTTFQSAHLRWLKQQVNNLQDLRYTRTAPQDLDRQLFAAREELDNYVEELRKTGINI